MMGMGREGVLTPVGRVGRLEVGGARERRGRRLVVTAVSGMVGSETVVVSGDAIRFMLDLCGVMGVDWESMVDGNPIGVAEGVLWPRPEANGVVWVNEKFMPDRNSPGVLL